MRWTRFPASFLRLAKRLSATALAVAVVAAAGAYAWKALSPASGSAAGPLTAVAARATLRVTVTERGNLESCETVDGICEVNGYDNKIIHLVAEGSEVKPGDVVVRIDTQKIDKEIQEAEQRVTECEAKVKMADAKLAVQRNQNESDINAAELELMLAELDLKKYDEGDYKVNLNDIQGMIAQARFEYERAQEEVVHARTLVKKGFREPEYLRQKEEDARRWGFNLARDEEKLLVLERFERERKHRELEAKAIEAKRKLERAEANATSKLLELESDLISAQRTLVLRQKALDELKTQLERCTIAAKTAGIVAYANEEYWRSDRQIAEGAMVHFRQKIFSVPDMSRMQVKVNVHESLVKQVKPGQKARILVDAFPDLTLDGTVKHVSPLADSRNAWYNGGVKEYETIVTVDKMPEAMLRPGMTAEVEILVGEHPGVLAVPVQSVTEHRREHYVFVEDGQGFTHRRVEIGANNQRLVEVRSGIAEGQRVALDARTRGLAVFKDALDPDAQPADEPAPEVQAAPQAVARLP